MDELDHKGKWYDSQVNLKTRSLYSHASRKVLLTLLEEFQFGTHLSESKLLLKALDFIKTHKQLQGKYYPSFEEVPINKLIPSNWLNLVVEVENDESEKSTKINRMNYEIAILQVLCKQLQCKMIWVEGAYRFQDPDKDLPQDFSENRNYYYEKLGLPIDVNEFINPKKKQLHSKLSKLNSQIKTNNKVSLVKKKGGRIKVSPSELQAEPPNIKKLHKAIRQE